MCPAVRAFHCDQSRGDCCVHGTLTVLRVSYSVCHTCERCCTDHRNGSPTSAHPPRALICGSSCLLLCHPLCMDAPALQCEQEHAAMSATATPGTPLWLSSDVKSGFPQQFCARLHTQYGRMKLLHRQVVVCFPGGCILQVQSAGRRHRLVVNQSIRRCIHLHRQDGHCRMDIRRQCQTRIADHFVLRTVQIPLELRSQRLTGLRLCLELPLHGLRPRRCMRR
jgi:hypothetical protein